MTDRDWSIRRAGDGDVAALTRLFFVSVREGAGPDYTEAQREAWAPDFPETHLWQARLADQKVWLAETGDGEVLGFLGPRDQMTTVQSSRVQGASSREGLL